MNKQVAKIVVDMYEKYASHPSHKVLSTQEVHAIVMSVEDIFENEIEKFKEWRRSSKRHKRDVRNLKGLLKESCDVIYQNSLSQSDASFCQREDVREYLDLD